MKTVKFGSLIREYRTRSGYTQASLAEALGYDSAQFISLLERDQSKCPIQTMGQLIVLLNIPEKDVVNALLESYQDLLQDQINSGKQIANRSRRNK